LGFATLVAIDAAEDGQIELNVQLAITAALSPAEGGGGGGGGGSEAPVWTVSSKAKNFANAIEQVRTYAGKYPFWSHTRVIIIGEELARKGIAPILDYLIRNRDFRFSTKVMVSQGSAKDLLQVVPKLSKLPAEHLINLNQIAKDTSVTASRTLLDLILLLLEQKGTEAILPLLTAEATSPEKQASSAGKQGQDTTADEGQNEEKSLAMSGLAVFRGDKMVGTLDATDSRSVLWLRGESKRGTLMVEVPGQGYVVQGQIYARRVLRLTNEDDRLRAKIIIYQDGDLIEHNLTGPKELNSATMQQLDALLSARIEADVQATLKKIQQELRADIIGIGDRAYRLYPKVFESVNWEGYFPEMPIEVEVHAHFRRTGELLEAPFASIFES